MWKIAGWEQVNDGQFLRVVDEPPSYQDILDIAAEALTLLDEYKDCTMDAEVDKLLDKCRSEAVESPVQAVDLSDGNFTPNGKKALEREFKRLWEALGG